MGQTVARSSALRGRAAVESLGSQREHVGVAEASNPELSAIFTADQADRQQRLAFEDLHARDAERRQRVEVLLGSGLAPTAEDLFHAAMVFQHGGSPAAYERAHELAEEAVRMGHERARWLAAASLDRWLMSTGRPQKYGTQYRALNGVWVLHEVDPATTDDERAEWSVPGLQVAVDRAAAMNA